MTQHSSNYDELLKLTEVQKPENMIKYFYDEYSRLIEKQYPNNTKTTYGFNEYGQRDQLSHHKKAKDYRGIELETVMAVYLSV